VNELDVLIKKRIKLIVSLVLIMVSLYGTLFISMSFFPEFLGEKSFSFIPVNNGFLSLILIVLGSIATCSYYIRWMETHFEPFLKMMNK
jgi:uncharacterized membrane protein (DUF485 family)